jgi:hypothetical protein
MNPSGAPGATAYLSLILLAASLGHPDGLRAAGAEVPFQGARSVWHDGFERYDFIMDEETLAVTPFPAPEGERFGVKDPPKGQRRCIVVAPKEAAAGKPWSWRGCFGITSRRRRLSY